MAITITQRAAVKIREAFLVNEMPENSCLRVGIKGGGCSGCASSGGGTRGLGWLGLVGLLLGWRRRH